VASACNPAAPASNPVAAAFNPRRAGGHPGGARVHSLWPHRLVQLPAGARGAEDGVSHVRRTRSAPRARCMTVEKGARATGDGDDEDGQAAMATSKLSSPKKPLQAPRPGTLSIQNTSTSGLVRRTTRTRARSTRSRASASRGHGRAWARLKACRTTRTRAPRSCRCRQRRARRAPR
jgi:hypothetical protein